MMRILRPQAFVVIVLVSACGAYQPPPNTPTAKLHLKGNGNTWICVAGERQWLKADQSGYVDIPAGSRVSVGAPYAMDYNGVLTTCDARSSFVPEAGRRYSMEFRMDSNKCGAWIFKENSANPTTPELEPSIGPGLACGHPQV
jgi:hypothetical protein